MRRSHHRLAFTFALLSSVLAGCREDGPDGPNSIAAPDIAVSAAPEAIAAGKELFVQKQCNACHKIGVGPRVGPDLGGIMARHTEKWIARMVLDPETMVREDRAAKHAFDVAGTLMPDQHVDPKTELPALLAYLKANGVVRDEVAAQQAKRP